MPCPHRRRCARRSLVVPWVPVAFSNQVLVRVMAPDVSPAMLPRTLCPRSAVSHPPRTARPSRIGSGAALCASMLLLAARQGRGVPSWPQGEAARASGSGWGGSGAWRSRAASRRGCAGRATRAWLPSVRQARTGCATCLTRGMSGSTRGAWTASWACAARRGSERRDCSCLQWGHWAGTCQEGSSRANPPLQQASFGAIHALKVRL